MPTRAFYLATFEEPEGGWPGAVRISGEPPATYLLASESPSPALEDLGAEFLGERLSDLSPDHRAAVTDETGEVPRIVFAGDAIEDYR